MREHIREAHVRRLSSGKKILVRRVYSADVGGAGLSQIRIGPLKHGQLTKWHYHPVQSIMLRHRALKKAIKAEKVLPVFHRLMAIHILTKRHAPVASKIYKMDAMWIRKQFQSKFKTPLKK
jgi:hypothetical protein